MAKLSEEAKKNKMKYIDNYNRETYDQIQLRAPKGMKERMEEAARAAGVSRQAFILNAIEEKLDQ